jgi:curved DNA-binding protein CbpA
VNDTSSSTTSSNNTATASDQSNPIDTDEKHFIDQVKKNYRKLSLKHHPDKLGGNVDTFRLLNRAQRVLLDTKLRTQYDLLGIDLDDDEVENDTNNNSSSSSSNDTAADNNNKDHHNASSSSQGILQEIASNILAGVLQLGVRTSTLVLFWLDYAFFELTQYVFFSLVPICSFNGNRVSHYCTILVYSISSILISTIYHLSYYINEIECTRWIDL